MAGDNLNDLVAFLAVAEEQNFTRAAGKLGVSQSALSQNVRNLETKLGLRLLTRTTRRVAPTEAGEHLIKTIGPRLEEIRSELAAVTEQQGKPAGIVRVVSSENAAQSVLWPAVQRLLPDYPDVKVELIIEAGRSDIIADRYDAGVRPGELVAQGMISVPIGPDLRMAVVGAPAYLASRMAPATPQDLTSHNCINLRLPMHGGLYPWDFEKDGHELRVKVEGQLAFNTAGMILAAALGGYGLAYLTEQQADPYLADGRLIRVLEDWCPPFAGYHLYYPDRRASSSAFRLLVDTLRYRK